MAGDSAASLLIEIGTEELPPGALDDLSAAFMRGVCDGLIKRDIEANVEDAKAYCSPRRLAVLVPAVARAQPDQMQERRGPAVSAGLDANGEPTRALAGFAQSCGVEVAELGKLETDKGAWFVHRAQKKGQPTAALIGGILSDALKVLPIPKPMRWGNHDHAFVRPVHWLVMLHGADVVAGELFGIESTRYSRGHRFHHPEPVAIVSADAWLDVMRDVRVIADPAERRQRVRDQIERVTPVGTHPHLSDGLLAEITNLTEWPVAIACTFGQEFLEVPAEALVMTMEVNQKFVPVFDVGGNLTEHFIGVANIESKDPAQIRQGYERVIRPRFADAKFFYDEDRKQPLGSYQESLQHVTYQQALGSVWDKCVRVAELARVIANRLRETGLDVDAALTTHAAALSKCDLMTRMVGEFPELQGIMGRYYASQSDRPEDVAVAQALEEFYRPRSGGDRIAEGRIAQVLAVAERLDTLAGIFAVGMKPSGNKDPFALRRTALGLGRTLIEAQLQMDLPTHIMEALAALPESAFAAGVSREKAGASSSSGPVRRSTDLAAELYQFIVERLRGYYADKGVPGEAFEAVRVLEPADLTDFDVRVRAVAAFAELPEAEALAAANKRIGNLLRQATQTPPSSVDESLLEAGAESELAHALVAAERDCAPLRESRDYVGTLKRLAHLREPVDAYFDAVMVMCEDPFLAVADIALLPHG